MASTQRRHFAGRKTAGLTVGRLLSDITQVDDVDHITMTTLQLCRCWIIFSEFFYVFLAVTVTEVI